ncbi:MAG: MFS transporter, partial [Proteobacteria bacterium]|nr:MFS transporter [Pseudomonadota bacterium]
MSAEDHAADVRPVARPAVRWRGLLAVIGSMTMMAMFYGYTGPLLSIVLEANGVSGSLIGANAAVQMAAVFIILPCMPWLIRRFGP